LKIETQSRDDHQITMIVELEPEQMVGAKHRAARKISERKSIPGFRPGKAPYDVVVRSFGEKIISDEAVDLLLDEIYPKALEETKLEPAAAGSLEKVEDLESTPKFTFTVPLAPEVGLGDYRSIRLPYDWIAPGEDKVDGALEELRQMYAKTETVDRTIENGDFVMVDLKAFDSKSADGDPAIIDRPGTPIFIRKEEKSDEYPFQGFSKGLIGLSVDESKAFTYKYPKDTKDEKLQGKTLKFDVFIKMIRGSILPELNDEFAKQTGPFANVQALRDALKANLATQSKADYDDDYYSKVLDLIKAGAKIKYPPQVIDHEVEHVLEDLKSRLSKQGMDLEAYLKSRNIDEAKFVADEAKPAAIKRLERSFIFDKLASLEKLEVNQQMLQDSFEQTLGEYQGDSTFQKALRGKSKPPKQLMNAVAMESANRAYVQQTLNRLKEIATGQAPKLEVSNDGEDISKSKPPKKPAKKDTSKSNNKKGNVVGTEPESSKNTSIKTSKKVKREKAQ
jgi:trigger factor